MYLRTYYEYIHITYQGAFIIHILVCHLKSIDRNQSLYQFALWTWSMNNNNNSVVVLPDKFNEFLKQCHNLMEDVRNHQNCREDFSQFELAFERHVECFLTCSCRFLHPNYLFTMIFSKNLDLHIHLLQCILMKPPVTS